MPTAKDIELFREAVKDVKPLKRRHHIITGKKNIAAKHFPNRQNKKLTISQELSDIFVACTPEETLFFSRKALPTNVVRQIKQGKMPIAAVLDLHGKKLAQAKHALVEFLWHCKQHNLRQLLIIHGKGSTIIKSAVNAWLRSYPSTLAFCSALPKDGGAGAIYLLLARN